MAKSKLPLFALLLFGGLCAAWLLSLDPRERFTTDITELLPAHERDPETRLALSLVKERQARVVLIALDAPAGATAASLAPAADAYVAALRASPAFADVRLLADSSWQRQLGQLLHARRFDLLLPGWFAEQRRAYVAEKTDQSFPDWLALRATAALDVQLASPEGAATAELLASDPLLLLPALIDRASALASAAPAADANSRPSALVWAETAASPLSEEGQEPVFAALASAEAAAQAKSTGLAIRFTGVARFAAAAKSATKAEISRLNIFAIAAVLLVTALFLRRLHRLLHLLPVVLLSTLGAAAITTLVFPRVHVLVFALGSLLSGVAVDYGFYVVLARRPGETYRARLRRLALPLLGGAGTTFAGFLALTVSELPLVRQLGVYVAAGIVSGLGVTLLYFALFPDLDLAPREPRLRLALPGRWRIPLRVALVVLAVFGLSRLHWHDDLRNLEYPSPALRAGDAELRAAFGETSGGATFLTRGASYAEARARWQKLADAAPADAPVTGVALLTPAPDAYADANMPETREALARFAQAFRSAANDAGFDLDALKPFFADFAAYLETAAPPYETLVGETLDALPGPLGLLAHHAEGEVWLLSSAPRAFVLPPAAEGTFSLTGIEGLNTLFARYRVAAGRLSFVGIGVLVLLSCCLHGPRLGLRTASLPLLATALAFGLLALRGEPFGLFHLLGALLGVCLADDYAHFAHADDGTPSARAAIRLSAFATTASFSVLMLSAIPAVSALGATVALIVILALVFVETDLFSLRRHA